MEIEESIDVTASPVVNAHESIVCPREEDHSENDEVGDKIRVQSGKVFVIMLKTKYALSRVAGGGERSQLCL